jgi:hypothetical protein
MHVTSADRALPSLAVLLARREYDEGKPARSGSANCQKAWLLIAIERNDNRLVVRENMLDIIDAQTVLLAFLAISLVPVET